MIRVTDPEAYLSIGGPFWMTEIIELIQYVDKDQAALYIPKDVS